MTTKTDISAFGNATGLDEARAGVGRALKSLAARTLAWIETCADYRVAAAIYEQLSKLSDAELRSRGLSRATLGADIARMCDRTE